MTGGSDWIDPADFAGPVEYPYGKTHVAPDDRKPGWKEWLKEHELWDSKMDEEALYYRYFVFKEAKFGAQVE